MNADCPERFFAQWKTKLHCESDVYGTSINTDDVIILQPLYCAINIDLIMIHWSKKHVKCQFKHSDCVIEILWQYLYDGVCSSFVSVSWKRSFVSVVNVFLLLLYMFSVYRQCIVFAACFEFCLCSTSVMFHICCQISEDINEGIK